MLDIRKNVLPVGEKAALIILLSLSSSSLLPPANTGYRDGFYPHILAADKIPLTETAVYSYQTASQFNIYCCSRGKSASSILLLMIELLYMSRVLSLVFFYLWYEYLLFYLFLNRMICIL